MGSWCAWAMWRLCRQELYLEPGVAAKWVAEDVWDKSVSLGFLLISFVCNGNLWRWGDYQRPLNYNLFLGAKHRCLEGLLLCIAVNFWQFCCFVIAWGCHSLPSICPLEVSDLLVSPQPGSTFFFYDFFFFFFREIQYGNLWGWGYAILWFRKPPLIHNAHKLLF